MPQPMTPAPDAGQGLRKAGGFARQIAQFMAGAISPQPNTLGAMGIAGIRSMLPGGGTYEQERERYTDAAAPSDSVLDSVPALPGEDLEASLRRRFSDSPAHQRALMEGGSMAAPLAVHASPVKWSGQPTRAKVGTGEGGAAYGEGLYATVPSNAKGIDQRYRVGSAEPTVTFGGRPPAMGSDAASYAENMMASQLQDGLDVEQARMAAMRQAETNSASAPHAKAHWDAVVDHLFNVDAKSVHVVPPEAQGSFHVWDVPDRLMDYDAPLSQQPELASRMRDSGMVLDSTNNPGDLLLTLPGLGEARPATSLTGKDLIRNVGQLSGVGDRTATGISKSQRIIADATGVKGHTYAGEAGSARTSGIEGDVPNFVIYDDAAVKPLGTFGSADEFLASDLYKQLKARIDAEDALRKEGKATPEAYAQIRAMFGGSP